MWDNPGPLRASSSPHWPNSMPFLSLNKTQTKKPQETHTLKTPTKTHTKKETKIYKQKTNETKKKSKESNMSQKKSTKIPLSLLCVTNYSWAWSLPLSVVNIQWDSIGEDYLWVFVGARVHFPLSVFGPTLIFFPLKQNIFRRWHWGLAR